MSSNPKIPPPGLSITALLQYWAGTGALNHEFNAFGGASQGER